MRFGVVRFLFRLVACAGLAGAGCAGNMPELPPELLAAVERQASQDWHRGPEVDLVETGPARFVQPLYQAFSNERAMEMVRFIDRYYRAPGNPAYDAVVDRLEQELRTVGFGKDPRLKLEVLSEEMTSPAWEPKSGRLVLHRADATSSVLHAFDSSEDVDRVMLPINAPSCNIEGTVAMHLEELRKGMILVTDVPAFQVLQRAKFRGAAAIVSASLGSYNLDPSGKERHRAAIQYRRLPPGTELPVMQISPSSFEAIETAHQQAAGSTRRVRLELQAEVEFTERPLRTLAAVIEGAELPGESVVMGSHIQEPGACDNASGVAGLLESALGLVQLLEEEKLPWPKRTLVFIWGDEYKQTEHWLDHTDAKVVAGISSDMTGQSKDTGAIALLERMPDPGAITTLPPDEHSLWGAGQVSAEALRPNGLSIIARCAMIDVGVLDGGWESADHPWEGGSDHDVFINRNIPAVLFWHFTDFTYHTSLDRIEFVDPSEMRRTGTALLATALAMADPEPADLERYLNSLQIEEGVRVEAAEKAGDHTLAELWRVWSRGSRAWLRNHCLGIEEELPR